MAKYLDPKADVTFKKVFGEHKNLVMSLLNALLPLEDGKQVESIEYLPPELVPELNIYAKQLNETPEEYTKKAIKERMERQDQEAEQLEHIPFFE